MSIAEDIKPERRTVDQVPDACDIALEDINLADGVIFEAQKHWEYFARLRNEDPVHYCKESEAGPFWSVTKFHDIISVDTNHKVFSSEPSIGIFDQSFLDLYDRLGEIQEVEILDKTETQRIVR